MQPDEIIQTFEWSDLNEAEKFSIKNLASNEQEFNLIKSLLKASSEEILGMPVISESVKEKIIVGTSAKTGFIISKYWYMAAAAIIAFGFLTFILFNDKNENGLVKTDELPQSSPITKPLIANPPDTISFAKSVKPKLQIRQPDIIKEKKSDKNIAAEISSDTLETEFYVKNVSVKQEKDLLNFITEIF